MDVINLDGGSTAVRESLGSKGFALASVAPHIAPASAEARDQIDEILPALGRPIQVFGNCPKWRPIGVRVEKDPTRSQGVGASPLHMDFVNAANPPDLVVLYCARADPQCGGATLLAQNAVTDNLSRHFRQYLRQRVYRDGRVKNLHNVGKDINPFAVSSPDLDWHFRYTGHLLNSAPEGGPREAVRHLDAALREEALVFVLASGEALFIDQRRMVHGREPLGTGQDGLSSSNTRLLWQRFMRVDPSINFVP